MSKDTEIKRRPILFSAPMVRAILDGRKTQTRRVINPQPHGWNPERGDGNRWWWCVSGDMDFSEVRACPYGKPGDELWVRETLRAATDSENSAPFAVYAAGRAAVTLGGQPVEWRWTRRVLPSIHMPREASRLTLKITTVGVQRLQDITDEEARAEGVALHPRATTMYPGKWVADFAALWDKINPARPWAVNPWVWVVGFEVAANV